MNILEELNLEQASQSEAQRFSVRDTVRAVIFDNDKNIALLKVSVGNFYKLPGGGVEDDEDLLSALKRECLEEAGVEVFQPVELGLIIEIKKAQEKIQNSFCYLAYFVGEKQYTNFTENEREAGYSILWVPLSEAIQKISEAGYSNLAGEYVYKRELAILNEVLKYERKF